MPTLSAPATRRIVTESTARRGKKKSAGRAVVPEDLCRFRLVAGPQLSPDGEHVVFVEKHVGDKNEYVANLWLASRAAPSGRSGRGAWGEARQFTAGGRDSHPRWSPDGRQIAFIGARDKARPQLFVILAGGGEAVALTDLPEGSIGTFRWSPDGTKIAMSYRQRDPDWTEEAVKARKDAGLNDPPRVIDHYFYRLDGDGYFNAQRYELVLVDVATGEHRAVYRKDTLGFFSFDFSPDGKQLVIGTNTDRRAGLRGWNDDLVKLTIASGKLTKIPNLPAGPKAAVRWSPDGKRIAYAGREGDDHIYSTENLELWVCDPVNGQARCLTGEEDYCLLAAPMTDTAEVAFSPVFEWSPDSRRLYVQIGWHGELHLASVPAGGGKLVFHTSGQRTHALGNLSADGRSAALVVGSPTKLDEVHVADLGGNRAATQAVTDLNRDLLAEVAVSAPTEHRVKTRDGTWVHVWVIKPPGARPGRKHPAVLEIHGGPHAQYGVGFFHEFQTLAAEGYVVVYANPRGSKGYGRDHCHAIRGSWGDKDWVDLQAVIDFMLDQPYIDAKRMGVMGGSYGGYMTNWIIGHTKVFAGAITDRCVSNLVSMQGSSDLLEPPDHYFPGNAWDRPEKLWEMSPLKYLGKARTPTLIIHSEGDLRCNVEQAEQVYSALTMLNVPTRLVRYPRTTSHGMSRGGPPDMRLHRLHQILEWWGEYL